MVFARPTTCEKNPSHRDVTFSTGICQVCLCFQLLIVYIRKKLENSEKFNRTCKEQFSQPCWKRFVGACKKFCSTDSNNFFLNTWYPSQTVPLDTESAVLTNGQQIDSNLQFFSIKIRKFSKKRKIFFLFKLFLYIIAQTGRRMLVILNHFSKNLEANEMKRFVFKKHACILLKSIFNTVGICSFVCWVPCNLFSVDLQLLRDILKTETWFFNWSSPSAFMFSTGYCLQS